MLSGLCRNQGRLPTRRRAPDWRDASLVRCLRGPRPLAKRERTIGVNRAPRPCCWPLLACEAAAATQSRHCCEIRIWPPACSRCLMWPASAARMKRPPPPPSPPSKGHARRGASARRCRGRTGASRGSTAAVRAAALARADASMRGGAAARRRGWRAVWLHCGRCAMAVARRYTSHSPISSQSAAGQGPARVTSLTGGAGTR